MSLEMKFGAKSKLQVPLTATDTILKVAPNTGDRFNIASGNHVYLSVKANDMVEIVKVVARSGDNLTVIRGQDNTSAKAWLASACIVVEWNPAQLCEYVKSCTGSPNTGMSGDVCIDCGDCLVVENGLIISKDGGSGCQ